jgi:hypothetical protein
VSLTTAYEGTVTYLGPDPNNADGYLFDVPGLTSQTDTPPRLSIQGASALLPEPAIGQELWLSYPSFAAQALRESQGGPLLLASSFDAADELANLLGESVTLEGGCEYVPTVWLRETVFGTAPEVRVASGTSETLELDGRSYHAWATSLSYHPVTVYPAD